MREDDLPELGRGVSHAHGERSRSDEFRAGVTNHMHTEDAVVLGIDDHLAQACLAFILRHESTGEGHRQFAYLNRNGHGFRLGFRDTYGRYFRVRINDRRNGIIGDSLKRNDFEHATYSDFGLTSSDVRQHNLTGHVTAGIDIRQVRFAEIVDYDRAAI